MTKERYNQILSKLDATVDYDVSMLVYDLKQADLNITSDEAFIMCAVLLGMNCLLTFVYDGKNFFTHDQVKLLINAMEVKHE